MRVLFYFAFVSLIVMTGCMKKPAPSQASLKSPDGKILLEFMLQPDGAPAYSVSLADKVLLDTSTLGFT